MSSKRKHTTCTLKEKLEVLQRLDKGESATKLSLEFGVGKATIADWKKNRSKIEQFCATTSQSTLEKRQTAKQSQFDQVDEALFMWFSQERQKGTPLSGPLIQEKAIHLNKLINGDESSFMASSGWLDRWKRRHGVRQLTITGEKLSADLIAGQEYVEKLNKLIMEENYSPQQIYNADETGLNFKALPNKSLASREESSAPGFKMSKERVTVMACSNAAGNHKLPLMFIGKSAKPRAFKNMNLNSLPVYYRSQKKAWMDGVLFKEWFTKQFVPAVTDFNSKNNLPNRALLLLDNAPSHPDVSQLTVGEIKVHFMPPNVTAILQPMDQGILQNIKLGYKKQFLRSLIEENDGLLTLKEKIKNVNLKDVIYWSAESWESVSEQTLRKSWKKIWPTLTYEETVQENNDTEHVINLLKKVPGCEDVCEADVTEWAAADGYSHGDLTDDDIVTAVTQQTPEQNDSDDDANNDDQLVSHEDATAAFELGLRYIEQQPTSTPADVMFIKRWRNIASSNRFSKLRQKTMTDFFHCK